MSSHHVLKGYSLKEISITRIDEFEIQTLNFDNL